MKLTEGGWFRTAAAIFFVFLWGTAFIPSKIGVLASSPFWFLTIRFVISGAVALAIALASGSAWPRSRAAWTQVVLLGATFMVIAGATDAMYALLAGRARTLLSTRRTRLVSRISGLCMMGGGVWLALTRAR